MTSTPGQSGARDLDLFGGPNAAPPRIRNALQLRQLWFIICPGELNCQIATDDY